MTAATLLLWALAGIGLVSLWRSPSSLTAPRMTRIFLTGLAATSFIAVCPGFYFRPHYFILMLPAVALLAGAGIIWLERVFRRLISDPVPAYIAKIGFVAILVMYSIQERDYLLHMASRDLIRTQYGLNPFIEASEIGRYIQQKTTDRDRIAVIGSEPEIYFYAQRKSATGYLYTYPLMELQTFAAQMQAEMIREIETAHPAYIVFASVTSGSWSLPKSESELRILRWTEKYLRNCYDIIGIADPLSLHSTVVRWEPDLSGYDHPSNNALYTLRRKSDAPCHAIAAAF